MLSSNVTIAFDMIQNFVLIYLNRIPINLLEFQFFA
jgi:hypothetical protein